jgi:copper transport protein
MIALRRWRSRVVLACAIAAFAALVQAAPARAHASLVASDPRDGAVLAQSPAMLTLRFNEPVSPLVFRLIGPDGRSRDLQPQASDGTVALRIPAPLAEGTQLLSWRVVSADGHPVGGALLFSVGRATTAPSVQAQRDMPLSVAIWTARFAIYLTLFIGVGGAFFGAWTGTPLPRAAKATITGALLLGAASLPLSVAFQGADALALPLTNFWRPMAARAGYDTAYGTTAVLAGGAVLLALAAMAFRQMSRALALAALVAAGLALAASGHTSNAAPQWLMRPTVFVHVACIGLWAGSLVPLFGLLRERGSGPTRALMHFSQAIPFVLAALLASGIVLAVVQIGHVAALWDTAYGRIFLAKCAALAALAALAGFNRFVLTPALVRGEGNAAQRMRASIAGEIALVLAIFGLVGLWRFTPPPRALAAAEPAFVHLHTEQAMADVSINPGHAGPVSVQVRLSAEDFSPLKAREVRVMLSQSKAGIEPLIRQAEQTAPGTWQVGNLMLPAPGVWTIEIVALVTDFDRVQLDGPVVIAP